VNGASFCGALIALYLVNAEIRTASAVCFVDSIHAMIVIEHDRVWKRMWE